LADIKDLTALNPPVKERGLTVTWGGNRQALAGKGI